MSATRRLLVGSAIGCLLTLGGVEQGSAGRPPVHTNDIRARRRADPAGVFELPTERRVVALTFDDGPDPDYTPAILQILAQAEVTATFFVIGRNAERHPDLVAAIAMAGHRIGNHTQDHLWLDHLPAGQVAEQIAAADRTLAGQGVAANGLFRPPRGWTSATVAEQTARAGKRGYYWTACLEAHLRDGTRAAAAIVAGDAQPGGIILCHDGGFLDGPNPQRVDRSRTVAALPGLLDGLRARGFGFLPL